MRTKEEWLSQKVMKEKILKINGKYCQMIWAEQVR